MHTLSNGSISKKNVTCIVNILDISTKPIPLCSLSSPLSSEPIPISLAILLLNLDCLAMPLKYKLQPNIIANSTNNGARPMELGSLDGEEDGEHDGVGFEEIS